MKFYKNKKINNNLIAIYSDFYYVKFLKNGKLNNAKNASYVSSYGLKLFALNGKFYGYEDKFTKHSWRKLTKLQAFL